MDARASNTQAKNMLSLPAPATAATAFTPRPLTDHCTMTEPMAVIENWSPMGSPVPSILRARRTSKCRSSFPRCSTGKRRIITITHPIPESSWLTAVATAAPATSIPHTMIRNRSSTIFTSEASTRKTTGVRLSPSARRMPPAMLYRMQKGIEAKMMLIYRAE